MWECGWPLCEIWTRCGLEMYKSTWEWVCLLEIQTFVTLSLNPSNSSSNTYKESICRSKVSFGHSFQKLVHCYIISVTAEPEDCHEEMVELSAAPTAKRPCQCCCQTYSEILSFLEKRSDAEQRLREEELALRREELEIQRSKTFRE